MVAKILKLFLGGDPNPEECGKARKKGNFWLIGDALLREKLHILCIFVENRKFESRDCKLYA